jgi:hypothetical protein
VHTLLRHWNGRVWSTVPSPNPSPMVDQLFSVSADSARDAWAVGDNFRQIAPGTQAVGTLTLHWNGQAWSKVASPKMGTDETSLLGVSALTPTNAWAVGSDFTSSGRTFTLILHWNGRTWSRVASPNPGVLLAVSAKSAANAWAAGNFCSSQCGRAVEADRSVTMHWDGQAWSKVPVPHPDTRILFGISTVSASFAWTVGTSCGATCAARQPINRPLILHWDGSIWSVKG